MTLPSTDLRRPLCTWVATRRSSGPTGCVRVRLLTCRQRASSNRPSTSKVEKEGVRTTMTGGASGPYSSPSIPNHHAGEADSERR
jgi:hypothetical protein